MTGFVEARSGERIAVPDYSNSCISQLPGFFSNTLLGENGGPLTLKVGSRLPLSGIRSVVFLLVDGFGMKQWNNQQAELPALQRFTKDGFLTELDSVFPSSTPVALSTLNTNGLLPAEHGLIEWFLYLEEIDGIIATIPFSEMGSREQDSLLHRGLNPRVLLDNPTTTYETFEKLGIATRVFLPRDFVGGAYTNKVYRGSELVPYDDYSELFSTLVEKLEEPERTTYNFVYWGDIDGVGHRFGPDSFEYEEAVRAFFGQLDCFLTQMESLKDTLFVISADHGQVGADPRETFYLDKVPGLFDLFKISQGGRPILPWGGARDVFLAIRDGKVEKALDLIGKAMGDDALMVESQVAIEAGLFGKVNKKHPQLRSRIGDILVLPKVGKTVWYHHPGQGEMKLLGQHGGLSKDEIKVPFGLLRIN